MTGLKDHISMWACLLNSTLWLASDHGGLRFVIAVLWLALAGAILFVRRRA
jgi:hypothetical protein